MVSTPWSQTSHFLPAQWQEPTWPKKPFFIMVGMNPPHSPYRSLDIVEEDFNLYKDQPLTVCWFVPMQTNSEKKAESARYYFASVGGRPCFRTNSGLPWKELKLDKNTIVVFTSDHGETMCSQFTDIPKFTYTRIHEYTIPCPFPQQNTSPCWQLVVVSPDIMPLLGLCNLDKDIPSKRKEVIILRFSMKIPCRLSFVPLVLLYPKYGWR